MAENGCIHKWNIDSQNVGTCSKCGEVRQFPYEKGGEVVLIKAGHLANELAGEKALAAKLNTRAKGKYYEANKDAILKDLLSTGRAPTCRKWNIPKASIQQLMYRWLTAAQRAAIPRALYYTTQSLTSPGAGSENGRLPRFPEFSSAWDPPVQLKWLEIYGELLDRHSSENG